MKWACRKTHKRDESGVTLVELMVVVAIVAILVAIAAPVFTRDTLKDHFENFIGKMQQDLLRLKFAAASSREDASMRFFNVGMGRYQMVSVTRQTPAVYTVLRQEDASPVDRVRVRGVALCAATPGSSGCTLTVSSTAGELRFTGISDLMACLGVNCTPNVSSATIFVETENGQFRGRLVIYQSTAHIRKYEGW